MKKWIPFSFSLLIAIASAYYGIYSSTQLLFNSRHANSIQASGFVLDSSKVYMLTNRPVIAGQDTICIYIPVKLVPYKLGYLYYDSVQWVFRTHSSIMDTATVDTMKNPFLPWCVSMDKKDIKFYKGGDTVPESILVNGIKINSPWGSVSDRIVIQIIREDETVLLKTRADGIGIPYKILTDSVNQFELVFGNALMYDTLSSAYRVLSFHNSNLDSTKRYMVEITGNSWKGVSYSIRDLQSNALIDKGTVRSFDLHDIRFTIDKSIPEMNRFLFIAYIFILLFFQLRLLRILFMNVKPFLKSIIALRMGLNAMLFMGLPILILASQFQQNRLIVIAGAIFLNLAPFIARQILRYTHKTTTLVALPSFIKKYVTPLLVRYHAIFLWLVLICGTLFVMNAANTHSETVFSLPALHITKLLILLFVYIVHLHPALQSEEEVNPDLKWLTKMYLLNKENIYTLAFAFILTLITRDFGSLLFTFFALLIIDVIKRKHFFIPAILVFALVVLSIFFLSWTSPSLLGEWRKAYRIISWSESPVSCDWANEADRQQVAEHYYLILDKINDGSADFTGTVIPANWKTVFYSDYAVAWSFKFGGMLFMSIFLIVLSYLVYYFLRIIFISLTRFQENDDWIFCFSIGKSRILVMWLSITLVQFVYPFISNMLSAPLTGQSTPLLSASNIEILFLIILIVSLYVVYSVKDYYYPITEVPKGVILSRSELYRKTNRFFVLFMLVVVSIISLRAMCHSGSKSEMKWDPKVENGDAFNGMHIPAKDKQGIINLAVDFIDINSITELEAEEKINLKNLACFYYEGKSYREVYHMGTTKKSLTDFRNKSNCDSLYRNELALLTAGKNSCFRIKKIINGTVTTLITNKYFSGFPQESTTIMLDLQVELNKQLEKHLMSIGEKDNIGSILVIENATGNILASASYPFFYNYNNSFVEQYNKSNRFPLRFIYRQGYINASEECLTMRGSLIKPVIGLSYLCLVPGASSIVYNNKSFHNFIKYSDSLYAAQSFLQLMSDLPKFNNFMEKTFDLPLCSNFGNAFIDSLPESRFYTMPLRGSNRIYRLAIGQQHAFPFKNLVENYVRIATGKRIKLSYYKQDVCQEYIDIPEQHLDTLRKAMNDVLNGTAYRVGVALNKEKIDKTNFICKTGTAEKSWEEMKKTNTKGNASSGFIICTPHYTIGIQLAGDIPENRQGLAAKDLFVKLIPTLKSYELLQ